MDKLKILGWREWFSLPELGITSIKAKIDTGARTSCLHAFEVEGFEKPDGSPFVRFKVHPIQDNIDAVIECECPVVDQRTVSDSGGHKELRYVIQTTAVCGDEQWPIEMTLTNRDTMRFRMLLGRTAMEGRFAVDPESSYLQSDPDLETES